MPEMNEEKIKLPIPLAAKVAEVLFYKHNINHWKKSFFKTSFDDTFTHEELSKITSLEFTNPTSGDCEGMELLPNLKSLSFTSYDDGAYTLPKDVKSIDDTDLTTIEKCKKLESLTIHKQSKISFLDVGKLPKLAHLDISDNHSLQQVNGIDKLNELFSFSCYGNESLSKIDHLDKTIEKGDITELDLDVLLFPSAIGYKTGTYNKKAADELSSLAGLGLSWSQSYGEKNERIKLSHSQMLQMHNKAVQIVSEVVNPMSPVRDKVLAVESYIAKNVRYDMDAYERNNATSVQDFGNGLTTNLGPRNGTSSSYNCIVNNLCCCEGYTRGEQYLLALCGIKSYSTTCIGGVKDTVGMSDSKKDWASKKSISLPDNGYHSIIRIDDNDFLYSDPTYNAVYWQRDGDKSMSYSLLTKDEMSQIHTLSFEEREINNNHLQVPRTTIEESLKSNALFRKTKMAEVEAQRKQLGQQKPALIRGMIPTGRN